ncbi:uridylate kinase [Thalassoglobus sp. JC818]|uniref:amino acid kinase family protein n=1 Tax=Thalassoglobus sp. JC818 TaxID=3232136 RepID=UPI0034573FC3
MTSHPTRGSIIVMKIGGSLFTLPDLSRRLRELVEQFEQHRVVLVPGGGVFADAVRSLDRIHELSPQTSHELAIRAMSMSCQLLEQLIENSTIVHALSDFDSAWKQGHTVIYDPASDYGQHADLPASWDVTSDSIAASLAIQLGDSSLILVKSIDLPEVCPSIEQISADGLVDVYFYELAKSLTNIGWCNLRNQEIRVVDGSGKTGDSWNPDS